MFSAFLTQKSTTALLQFKSSNLATKLIILSCKGAENTISKKISKSLRLMSLFMARQISLSRMTYSELLKIDKVSFSKRNLVRTVMLKSCA